MKTTDEGEYKVVIENEHGTDEKTFMLYVSGKNKPWHTPLTTPLAEKSLIE